MKKILTILLSVLMVATLGVVNVSAAVTVGTKTNPYEINLNDNTDTVTVSGLAVGGTKYVEVKYNNNDNKTVEFKLEEAKTDNYATGKVSFDVVDGKTTAAKTETVDFLVEIKGENVSYVDSAILVKVEGKTVAVITIDNVAKAVLEAGENKDYIAPSFNDKAVTSTTYDGTEQSVFTAGSILTNTSTLEMRYQLSNSGSWSSVKDEIHYWSTEVPTVKDAGTYYLFWRIYSKTENIAVAEGRLDAFTVKQACIYEVVKDAIGEPEYTGKDVPTTGLISGNFVNDNAWTTGVEYAYTMHSGSGIANPTYVPLTSAGLENVTSGLNTVSFRFHNVNRNNIEVTSHSDVVRAVNSLENTKVYDYVTVEYTFAVGPTSKWYVDYPDTYVGGTTAPQFTVYGVNGEKVDVKMTYSTTTRGYISADEVKKLADGTEFWATGTWEDLNYEMYDHELTLKYTVNGSPETMYRLYNPTNGAHLFTLSESEIATYMAKGWKNEGTAWESPAAGTEVYCLVNPNSGENFYTTSAKEYAEVLAAGWKAGKGFKAALSTDDGALPVYRLFNPNSTTIGSHMFTLDSGEMATLLEAGWKYEGVAFYVTGEAHAINWKDAK